MKLSVRRAGIALGALVEAGLVLWLLQGFLPAGLLVALLTVFLGALIYRDIVRREVPSSRDIHEP
jgi:hypothetical protein